MKRAWAISYLISCILIVGSAAADSHFYVIDAANPSRELIITSDEVAAGETAISMTFAGDCTLGGETAQQSSRLSFRSVVEKNGMAYPFAKLQSLFAADDFTVVNLEGVLSKNKEGRVKKKYNYIGDPAYVEILTLGSVECVNLANNHSMDYGQNGYIDTVNALNSADIAYFDEDMLCIFEKDGIRIGLTASLWQANEDKLKEQMALLRDLGCSAIVHTMHAGEEYERVHMASQSRIANAAVNAGASLVVGHHPHVAQDVELIDDVPIVYSLGNCCFGGNTNPRDYDALLLGAEFQFVDGELSQLSWMLHPITQSADRRRNNFQPELLSGESAARVQEQVGLVSSVEILPYLEGVGAVQ